MKIEKLPIFRIEERNGYVRVFKREPSSLRYEYFYAGPKLGVSKNLLYVKGCYKELFWFSGDMNKNCRARDVEEAAIIDNMALVKIDPEVFEVESMGYDAFNVCKPTQGEKIVLNQLLAKRQRGLEPSRKLPQGISFWVSNNNSQRAGKDFPIGEKIDCPWSNVHAFWDEKIFTLLCYGEGKYFLVRKECERFKVVKNGFLLVDEDGEVSFFPYFSARLFFK